MVRDHAPNGVSKQRRAVPVHLREVRADGRPLTIIRLMPLIAGTPLTTAYIDRTGEISSGVTHGQQTYA
jgi:hypothetical protein